MCAEHALSLYVLSARLSDGDGFDDPIADYPDLGSEEIEAATIYAPTYPLVGLPCGKPWTVVA